MVLFYNVISQSKVPLKVFNYSMINRHQKRNNKNIISKVPLEACIGIDDIFNLPVEASRGVAANFKYSFLK